MVVCVCFFFFCIPVGVSSSYLFSLRFAISTTFFFFFYFELTFLLKARGGFKVQEECWIIFSIRSQQMCDNECTTHEVFRTEKAKSAVTF